MDDIKLTRREWGDVHSYLALLFVSLIVVRIISALELDKKLFQIAAGFFAKDNQLLNRGFLRRLTKLRTEIIVI